MDLIDQLRALSAKIPKLKEGDLVRTEEGTKNALIMPFINALGYNVFDPTEVTPELVADVGTKKGEKGDYAILLDNVLIMLFECKALGTNLADVHASQLYRYFSVTKARFGILTDGAVYRFYADLDAPNIMDSNPFFVFDLNDIREIQVEQLKKFGKSAFDVNGILTTASEMKYRGLIKTYLLEQLSQVSEPFIRLCLHESSAYTGRFTQTVIDQFAPIVRESFRQFVNEQVENRLKTALASEEAAQKPEESPSLETPAVEPKAIVTTSEEIEGYAIVKAILHEMIDTKRIAMRDQQTYCGILLDDNNRRPICRMYFNTSKKYLGVFNEQRQEEKIPITGVDDLWQHAERIRKAVAFYNARSSE